MIQVIGIRRIVILLTLLSVNAAMGALTYMHLVPEQERTDRSLRSLRGQLSTVQSDIARMEIEFQQLDAQQSKFDALKLDGFFSPQTRSDAKELFSKIQQESGVIAAVVSVKSGVIEDNPEAQKAAHKVLKSPIEIQIKAFDDGDIYKYLQIAEKRFPGHLTVQGITISRTKDVTSAVLRAIASGANPDLVTADIQLLWRTMISDDKVLQKNEAGR